MDLVVVVANEILHALYDVVGVFILVGVMVGAKFLAVWWATR